MEARKICCHPYLFEGIQPQDEPPLGQHLIDVCGKMKVLDMLLAKLIGEGHKVLIFSQFVILLNVLEDYCNYREYRFCRIDGSSSIEQREKAIAAFTNKKEIPIFLLSTRAGGLGINLVAASRVIIYDIDWNPQNDNQAMDRAYRIGQNQAVHVFKLITEHTIEERMLEVQKYKLVWDELVIQKGAMLGRKKNEDPLANINANSIAMLGTGEIFRLEHTNAEKSLDEIIQQGYEKDKEKYE